jgi:hypothetical protein
MLILLALLAVTILLQGIFADPAVAAPPDVDVEVVPSSVELPTEGGAKAFLVVRNPSEDLLRDVRVTSSTDAGVKVEFEDSRSLGELAPESAHTWTFLVQRKEEGSIPGTVHFRVEYDWVPEGGTREVPQTAFASLSTKSRAPTTVDDAAEVQVKGGIASLTLSGQRPGKLFLAIKNKSDVPVNVKDIVPKGPKVEQEDIIRFECDEPRLLTSDCSPKGKSIRIEPYKSYVTLINATPRGRVTPGQYVLLFEVPVRWGWTDAKREGTLIATQAASVEVFGESGILTALGVPFLLGLPGVLVVATWDLLWRSFPWRAKDEMPPFPVTINTPQFWVVALSISGVVVYLYSLAFNHDYLQLYGFWDIAAVWVISVLLFGVLVYVVYYQWKVRSRRARIPCEEDEPIQILEKLKNQGRGIKLDRTEVKLEEKLTKLFLLQPLSDDEKKIWVGPYIVVEWAQGQLTEQDRQLREQIRKKLNENDPGFLAKLLQQGKDAGILAVRWDTSKLPGKPFRIKTEDVKGGAVEPDIIVVTR